MAGNNWFSEARFGMMVHWGLYALLAGEYKGRQMGGADNGSGELAEWAQSYFRIPCAEYGQLTKVFNPIFFDADEWVRMAKDAGMRYIVITSKHHEGFAMFKSDADAYNVVDATPFGRDVIGELAEACRKHGVKLGLYYSQELDWHEPDGGGYCLAPKPIGSSWTNDWDFEDGSAKDFSRCFEKKIKPQVKEILTRYGDISLIWFDTPGVITPEQSDELYEMVKKYQPDCLVNSRIGNGRGDYVSLGDNQIPSGRNTDGRLYETAATLNDTWGYKAYDQNWKTPGEVISLLTRLCGRGVNYLLNVGPDHMGRIPAAAQEVFRKVGEWINVNSEAVYGAEPSPYGITLPTGAVTAKGDYLYYVLDDPCGEVVLPGILSNVEEAFVLGAGKAEFVQNGTEVAVKLPDIADMLCPVVRLYAPGGIKVDDGIIALPGGKYRLTPALAEISGPISVNSAGEMGDWTDKGALEWKFNAEEAGGYTAEMTINGNHSIEPVEALVKLSINGSARVLKLSHDKDIDPLIARSHRGMISVIGSIRLEKGLNLIRLELAEKADHDMFRFAELRLEKAD